MAGRTEQPTTIAFRHLAQLISAFETGAVTAAERSKIATLGASRADSRAWHHRARAARVNRR